MKVVFWGTYDTGKPRNRILIRGLRENNVDLIECHSHVWQGVEDKSQVKRLSVKVLFFLKWLFSYPGLLWRYMRLPRHEVVVVGYLGQLDVLVLWPFARLRGARIVWDAFLSLHDTVVHDRRMASPSGVLSWLLYCWEWLACRAADKVILDTDAHRQMFVTRFKLQEENSGAVFVGVEPEKFEIPYIEREDEQKEGPLRVLFYGQFIPLHGIENIIRAARLLKDESITFTIVGSGQESDKIAKMMEEQPLEKVSFITWVEYEELKQLISKADVCLGIFGDSEKASRVIPNKVFQILQAGKPLITRDSEAIRELLKPEMRGVYLVKPSSPEEIATTLQNLSQSSAKTLNGPFHTDVCHEIHPKAIGLALLPHLASQ